MILLMISYFRAEEMTNNSAKDLSTKLLLHDGVSMPMFGLGVSKCNSGNAHQAFQMQHQITRRLLLL